MVLLRTSRFVNIILLLIAVCFAGFPAYAKYSDGAGEPNDPYQIATAEDLMLLGESPEDYDKHFILTADIDLDPNLPGRKVFDKAVIAPHLNPFDSWPFEGTSFTGVFNGNGHKISYLTIRGDYYLGLFGQLGPGAIISNLGLEAVDVNGTGMLVGGLVGWNEYGSIIASYITGMVTGDNYVGGFVGMNGHGSIAASSYSTGTVTGFEYVGGLVGSNEYGCIIACYSAGKVAGFLHVGGLVGWNASSIVASYSTGTATG